MTAYSNLRINPNNNVAYPRTMDPESHTIAEFVEFPGQYGFQLQDRVSAGTLEIVEDNTAQTPFNIVTTISGSFPAAGQILVNLQKGYCFANPADDGKNVICNYDGLGSNASLYTLQSLASSGPLTTKGDIGIHDGSAVQRQAVGSNGALLIADSSDSLGRSQLSPGSDYAVLRSLSSAPKKIDYSLISAFPKEQFYPLSRNVNGMVPTIDSGDTAHDWAISPGWCWDATFTKVIYLSASIVKRLDASWAVGTGNGGLDTGSSAVNTSYFIWAILRSDTGVVDILISASSTSPTMPANYDYKRLIGCFKTQSGAASNIQVISSAEGDSIRYRMSTIVNEVNVVNLGTSRTSYPCANVPSYDGIIAELLSQVLGSSGTNYAILTSLDQTDSAPSSSLYTHRFGSTFGADVVLNLRLNGSAQFGARSDKTSTTLQVMLLSYRFSRII